MPSQPQANPTTDLHQQVVALHRPSIAGRVLVASAPGTWPLIGEHTDPAGGIVVTYLTSARTAVVLSPRLDDAIKVAAFNQDGVASGTWRAELSDGASGEPAASGADPATRIAYLIETLVHRQLISRETHGYDVTALSDIPPQACLGEVAAFDAAVALALTGDSEDSGSAPHAAKLAEACAACATGLPPEQARYRYISALRGHAPGAHVVDYADGSITPLSDVLAALNAGAVMVQVPREFTPKHEELARRYAFFRDAAKAFGAENLRLLPEATPRVLDWLKAVHKVNGSEATPSLEEAQAWLNFAEQETARARAVVHAIRSRRTADVPRLLFESQQSLDEQLGVCEADTTVVELLQSRGALGARSIDAGNSIAVVAIVPLQKLENFTADLSHDGFASEVLHSGQPGTVYPAQ